MLSDRNGGLRDSSKTNNRIGKGLTKMPDDGRNTIPGGRGKIREEEKITLIEKKTRLEKFPI